MGGSYLDVQKTNYPIIEQRIFKASMECPLCMGSEDTEHPTTWVFPAHVQQMRHYMGPWLWAEVVCQA